MCTVANVTNALPTQSRFGAMGVSPILDIYIVLGFLSVRIIFIHFPLDHDHSRAPWSSRESLGIGWIFLTGHFPPRLPRPNVHQVPIVSACLPTDRGVLEAKAFFLGRKTLSFFQGSMSSMVLFQVWKRPFSCPEILVPKQVGLLQIFSQF